MNRRELIALPLFSLLPKFKRTIKVGDKVRSKFILESSYIGKVTKIVPRKDYPYTYNNKRVLDKYPEVNSRPMCYVDYGQKVPYANVEWIKEDNIKFIDSFKSDVYASPIDDLEVVE